VGTDAEHILPIQRLQDIDFEWKPENEEEFDLFIQKVSPEILRGFGFLPYKELTEPYRVSENDINTLLGPGRELFLFPSEWYNIIPNRFPVINIFAEVFPLENGKSDNSARSGCLSYGTSIAAP
jgi:hypothetical protein